jgi:DNA-directed RNA polymerase subunit RPC12/RpoP
MARPTESEGRHRLVLGDEDHIRIRCTHCAKRLRVRSIHAGEMVKCPKCKHKVPVPARFDGLPALDEIARESVYEREVLGIPVHRLLKLAMLGVLIALGLWMFIARPWR